MRLSPLLLLAVACQSYEFQRVEPITYSQRVERVTFASRRPRPNVMLLVDNSQSMMLPAVSTNAACPTGCGNSVSNPCPVACPTRESEMKRAMGNFLSTRATTARFGLTFFPQIDTGDQCRSPVVVNEPLPPATRNDDGTDQVLISSASQVNMTLQSLRPNGGTPTAAALTFVGESPSLNDLQDGRRDLVVLLTDGLPNCNAATPANLCDCVGAGCSQPRVDACACTLAGSCTDSVRCGIGCLDSDTSVQAVRALRQKDISTVVVGFGADLARGSGPAVLKAMADEGNFPRRCPNGTSAECGGSVCNAAIGQCEESYYSATSEDELAVALERIWRDFDTTPCEFVLGERPDQDSVSVLVDDVTVLPGAASWDYSAADNTITFTGEYCARLERSTPQEPVKLEFRIVNRL